MRWVHIPTFLTSRVPLDSLKLVAGSKLFNTRCVIELMPFIVLAIPQELLVGSGSFDARSSLQEAKVLLSATFLYTSPRDTTLHDIPHPTHRPWKTSPLPRCVSTPECQVRETDCTNASLFAVSFPRGPKETRVLSSWKRGCREWAGGGNFQVLIQFGGWDSQDLSRCVACAFFFSYVQKARGRLSTFFHSPLPPTNSTMQTSRPPGPSGVEKNARCPSQISLPCQGG